MSDGKRIPVAWPVRWRRIRQRIVPVIFFVLAAWVCGLLWVNQGGVVHGIGEVEARRIHVTSPTSAVVTSISRPDGTRWKTLDRIEAGDLLVRLEPLAIADSEPKPEAIEIHSPLTGTIVAIHSVPGQVVARGNLLATIADDAASHVISYLPEDGRVKVKPGQVVKLRSRSSPATKLVTQVESVGRQIELLPLHQVTGPSMSQWGLPLRIGLPANSSFVPGSLVDVVFSAETMATPTEVGVETASSL